MTHKETVEETEQKLKEMVNLDRYDIIYIGDNNAYIFPLKNTSFKTGDIVFGEMEIVKNSDTPIADGVARKICIIRKKNDD